MIPAEHNIQSFIGPTNYRYRPVARSTAS